MLTYSDVSLWSKPHAISIAGKLALATYMAGGQIMWLACGHLGSGLDVHECFMHNIYKLNIL